MKKVFFVLAASALVAVLPPQAWAASGQGAPVNKKVPRSPAMNAREVVDKVVQPFGQDGNPATREKIAEALLAIGREMMMEDSRYDRYLIAFFDEVDRRFKTDELPAVRAMVAEILLLNWSKAHIRAILKEFDSRYGQNSDPVIQALYVRSLVERGLRDEVVLRYGEDKNPAIRAQAARALLLKASAVSASLRHLSERDAEIRARYGPDHSKTRAVKAPSSEGEPYLDILNEIERRYGQDEAPEVQEMVIEMLFKRANSFGWPGGKDEDERQAFATYEEINRRFGKGNIKLRGRIAQELNLRGLYPTSGLLQGTHEQIVRMFGEDAELQGWVGQAFLWIARRLRDKGDIKGALAAYDEVVRRLRRRSWHIVTALDEKSRLLEQQGDLEAALAAYEDIRRHYEPGRGDHDRIEAMFLVRKTEILEKQGKPMEAIALLDELEQRFGNYVDTRYGSRATKLRAAILARLPGQ